MAGKNSKCRESAIQHPLGQNFIKNPTLWNLSPIKTSLKNEWFFFSSIPETLARAMRNYKRFVVNVYFNEMVTNACELRRIRYFWPQRLPPHVNIHKNRESVVNVLRIPLRGRAKASFALWFLWETSLFLSPHWFTQTTVTPRVSILFSKQFCTKKIIYIPHAFLISVSDAGRESVLPWRDPFPRIPTSYWKMLCQSRNEGISDESDKTGLKQTVKSCFRIRILS